MKDEIVTESQRRLYEKLNRDLGSIINQCLQDSDINEIMPAIPAASEENPILGNIHDFFNFCAPFDQKWLLKFEKNPS